MRGIDHQQGDMFSYLSPEQRVRKDHPLRAVRATTDEILERMSPLFDAMYAEDGRPSIPPEKLLRAQLLQMLYSVRSERLLMEEIDYSILYRPHARMLADHHDKAYEGDETRQLVMDLGMILARFLGVRSITNY
jgi:transposase